MGYFAAKLKFWISCIQRKYSKTRKALEHCFLLRNNTVVWRLFRLFIFSLCIDDTGSSTKKYLTKFNRTFPRRSFEKARIFQESWDNKTAFIRPRYFNRTVFLLPIVVGHFYWFPCFFLYFFLDSIICVVLLTDYY